MKRFLSSSPGSMLVVVLFLAGMLGIFAAIAASVLHAAANSSRAFAENVRAQEAMRAAIEQVVARTGSQTQQAVGVAQLAIGNIVAIVTVRDEAARIDLNRADPKLLAGIFKQAGASPEDAASYAARVVDWRDDDDTPEVGGAERAAYRAAGRIDGPRNGPFLSTAELGLVLGIPPRIAAAVQPYVTVASGHEQINPLIADPPVLLALPGTSEKQVRAFLEMRKTPGANFDALTSQLGQVQDFVSDENGSAIRFEARVVLGPQNERRFEAVVRVVDGDTEPYRILSWDANPPSRLRDLPQ